jgi:IQ and AAA domain-containing protein
MSRRSIEREWFEGLRALERVVGDGKHTKRSSSSSPDAEIDAYVTQISIHKTLKHVLDGMTHAQRVEDGQKVLEALEIDIASRVAAAYEALNSGSRDLEDVLVDLKLTPDVLDSVIPRAAIAKRRIDVMEAWNSRISAAASEAAADKNSPSDAPNADEGGVVDDEETNACSDMAQMNDNSRDDMTCAKISTYARVLNAERAATIIQSAFRGYVSRTQTRIDAHRELVYLGMAMSEAMKTQDLRADEENALQRRLEGIRENEMQLASTAAEIRAEMLATRRSVIKDEIIAEKDRAASDIEENLTNTSKSRTSPASSASTKVVVHEDDVTLSVSGAIAAYSRVWSEANIDAVDIDRITTSALSDITNELKAEVDDEARACAAELKTRSGKKKKSNAEPRAAKASKLPPGGRKKVKGKVKVANEVDEKVFNELCCAKALVPTDLRGRLEDYVGMGGLRRDADGARSTMLDITRLKHRLAVSVVLPLTSNIIHKHAPHMKCVVLEGARQSGKSFLARLCAAECGAALFDLSPDVIQAAAARGDSAKILIKHVFTAAKLSTPSVILIRDIDRFFPVKGKKLKSDEDVVKLRKDLAKEIKALKPGTRCVVLCTSSTTTMTAATTTTTTSPKGFDKFFTLRLAVPLPDYSARGAVVRLARAPLMLEDSHRRFVDSTNATAVCHATEGMSSGAIFALMRNAQS